MILRPLCCTIGKRRKVLHILFALKKREKYGEHEPFGSWAEERHFRLGVNSICTKLPGLAMYRNCSWGHHNYKSNLQRHFGKLSVSLNMLEPWLYPSYQQLYPSCKQAVRVSEQPISKYWGRVCGSFPRLLQTISTAAPQVAQKSPVYVSGISEDHGQIQKLEWRSMQSSMQQRQNMQNNGVYEILVKAIHWKSLRCWRPLHDLGEAEADLHLLPVGTSLLRSRHPVVSVPAVSGHPGLCPSLGHHLVAPFLSCHPCRWHFRWFASFARSGKPLALARPELPHFLPFLPPHRKMPLHAHEPCLGVSFSAKVKNSTRSERCEQALPFKRHQSQKNH